MKNLKKGKYIAWGTIAILMLLWAFLWPIGNKMVMYISYGESWEGNTAKVYLSENYEEYKDDYSFSANITDGIAGFNLRWKIDNLSGIQICPTSSDCGVSISNIMIYVNDTLAVFLDTHTIINQFEITEGNWNLNENGFLEIKPENPNCSFYTASDETIASIKEVNSLLAKERRVGRISTVFVLLILALILLVKSESIFKRLESFDTWDIISAIAIVAVGVGVWMIAFHSAVVHPDEDDVIKCLNYGLNHLFPPDMRSAEIAETYSGYGYTKLANSTWYFLIAGKIAKLASILWPAALYYRVPNFVLFVITGIIYIKEIQKKEWLTISMGICAQAWYIFSYTTADALDFFLCFLILVELTDEDSLLLRTVKERFSKHNFYKYILLGVLFGFVFLGKPNYWVCLVLAFVVLLFKLFENPKDNRKDLFINYLIILAFFTLTVITRYAFDFYHYGFDISEVKEEMSLLYSAYDKNPATPVQDIAVTYKMAKYGHSLPELFMAVPTWFKTSFRSFTGLLADTTTKDSYYKIMALLYIVMISTMAYYGFKEEEDCRNKLQRGICYFLMIFCVVASVLNSYISDSQPQGRYLLPMLFIGSYIGYRTPQAFEKKYFRVCVIALQVLSTWYFVARGVNCFI